MEIKNLFKKINISPKKYSLYYEALTHSSYSNENHLNYNYERLEFLGDAIISYYVTNYLFNIKPELKVGEMSKKKIIMVQSKSEIFAAKKLNLQEYVYLGKSLFNDTKNLDRIYEDIYEALVGAIYLDQGISKATNFIKNTLIKYYENLNFANQYDYKSKFQELMKEYSKNNIEYKLIRNSKDEYKVELWHSNIKYGSGTGKRIKEAEQNAAKEALKHFVG